MSSSNTGTIHAAFLIFGAVAPLQSWAQAIEEVIVTATRREGGTDVPIAISALSADARRTLTLPAHSPLPWQCPALSCSSRPAA